MALIGVWAWRGTNEWGGKTALPDWDSIALDSRDVLIVFDSDVMSKVSVSQALVRLRKFLDQRGARVQLVYLSPGDGDTKVGLDDFLAAGKGRDDLLRLATNVVRNIPGTQEPFGSQYRATPHGLVWDKATPNGSVPVVLTNFGARIVAQMIEDDGAEQRRLFELEAVQGSRVRRFSLPTPRVQCDGLADRPPWRECRGLCGDGSPRPRSRRSSASLPGHA